MSLRKLPLVLGLALAAAPGLALRAAVADDAAPPTPTAPTAPDAAKDATAAHASVDWSADFDKAVEKAKAEKKDLFVDFTGSDWCTYCIHLHDEVLSQPEFEKAAAKDYVLVSLDFPHGPEAQARVPNPERNKELSEKYGVRGYPTVLLMTSEGDVYGRTGYEPGGAAKWVESMQKIREKGRPALLDAMALAKVFADAKGDARAEVVAKAIDLVEKSGEGDAWVEKVLPAARAAMEIDPENAKGLKIRAVKALLKSGTADAPVFDAARALDPKNEQGLLEQVVMAQVASVKDEETVKAAAKAIEDLDANCKIQDAERKQILYANAAFWNFQILNDAGKAKSWATKLKAVADPKNPRLQQLIEAILGKDEAPKAPESPETPKDDAK